MEVKAFVPPNQQRECAYWSDLENEGRVISIPLSQDHLEPANASSVRQIFKGSDYMVGEYSEVESVISFLNEEVLESRDQFQIPLNNSVEHILIFNGQVLAYIHGIDTENGEGDSEMFMCIEGVVLIEDNTMDQELLEIADWLRRAFSL